MSRMQAVNTGGPGTSTRLIASSAGNSVPSERIAWTSIRRPRRAPAPGAGPSSVQRSSARRCASRNAGGTMSAASSRPRTSSLRVSERALGRDVELEDEPVVVDGDHGVERRIEDRARVRRISAQRCLGRRRPGVAILDHRLTRIVASQRPRPPDRGTESEAVQRAPRRSGPSSSAMRPESSGEDDRSNVAVIQCDVVLPASSSRRAGPGRE